MAKARGGSNAAPKVLFKRTSLKQRTSIGHGKSSRPKNKSLRRNVKKYRGQGNP